MLIWGTKYIQRKLGYVAEFCPICRHIAPFLITKVSFAGHIYFISIDDGKTVFYSGTCQKCGADISVDSGHYSKTLKTSSDILKTLIQETFPDIQQHYQERLNLENEIRRNLHLLSQDVRNFLIKEPMLLLSKPLQVKLFKPQFDWQHIGIFLISFFGFPPLLLTLSNYLTNPIMSLSLGLIAFPLGFTYYLIDFYLLMPRRYVAKRVVPLLAQSLKPLHPSVSEIQTILKYLKTKKLKLGHLTTASKILKKVS